MTRLVRAGVLTAILLPTFAAAAPTTYEVDPVHSTALFAISHLGASTSWGRFNAISGEFVHDPAAPERSSIRLVLDADSVDTANERRDKHLKSPDFFDAKQFPEITFRSTRVRPIAAGDLEVTGELTLHGVTRPVTARADLVGDVTVPRFGHRRGYDVQFTLQRSDFGIDFLPQALGDTVKVFVSIEGIDRSDAAAE